MNKLLLLAMLLSTPLLAQEEMISSAKIDKEEESFNPRKSHNIAYLSFEGLKYDVPFNFKGARAGFSPRGQELWGGRVGVGRDWYIGKGVLTTTKLEGYYLGTLFSQAINGGEDSESVNFAFTKRTGQIYGIDAAQTLGMVFDFKTKNLFFDEWSYLSLEPYIEFGWGVGSAYNRLNYAYDTGTTPTAAQEAYQLRVNDQLVNSRIGGGINLISSSGYFFFMKATVNTFDIIKRKAEGFSQPNGMPRENIDISDKNAKIDPVTIYAVGGGYKF